MRLLKRALAALLMLAAANQAVLAQTYPTTTAVYTPHAVLTNMGTVSANATPSTPFILNNQGSVLIRVSGTFSALNATVQATELAGTSVTWQNISAKPVGGALTSTITAAGLYEVRVGGYKQVRVLVNTFTGTNVIFDAGSGYGARAVDVLPSYRQTYSATVVALAAATSATDFLTISGSPNVTVRVINITCAATGTLGAVPLLGVVRSTLDTGGTSSAITPVANDPGSPASQATVKSYTVNPASLGTAIGNIRAGILTVTPATTSTIGAQEVSWDFGIHPGEQEITLRGTNSMFAVNGNGTLVAATLPTCTITWTEE